MTHPNATISLVSGSGIGTVIVWLLGFGGINPPAEVGSAIGGAVAAIVLLIGRKGLRGIASIVWRGSGNSEEVK